MKPCLIVANAGAGSFSRQSLDRISARLAAGGLAVEQQICPDFSAMTAAAATAGSLPEQPLIIAAGGDGTINAVLNGLAGANVTCAILPLGTANVMASELGIRTQEEAVARILSGRSRPFTAGLLKNSTGASRFFLMAGVGLDGRIVQGVSPAEKKRLGKGAYILSTLRSFTRWASGKLMITTERETFSCSTVIVCNATRYGGSFSLAPAASIFSPTFELVAIRGDSRSLNLLAIAAALSGFNGLQQLYRTTAGTIRIEGTKPVQADGDYWGDSPVEIKAEPDYARIVI